ncbi:MAG: hypothetical protein RLZZ241_405 [Bacteroidota bacterium]|jgi:CitMHS family citrate-Mg2+:H+ or citrate-Ca2+:H+ symporter
MLALLGIFTIVLLLVLIMSKRISALVALILVPIGTALIGGFGNQTLDFITEGIKAIAPTGVMFIFAILFFGILTDAGTFRPIITRLLRAAGNDPARIAVATALLAMLVHLDGSGAVTFLITVPALLPLYDAVGMRRSTLATIVALGAGTMNILPWGGPTLRAASALEVPVTTLFNPLLLPVLIGLLFVLYLSYRMGRRERAASNDRTEIAIADLQLAQEVVIMERPKLLVVNMTLILFTVIGLVSGIAPPHVLFMLAFAVALTLNYPNLKEQTERINSHAKAALLMAGILFAAGCFTGILKGSGMITAMADGAVAVIPSEIGSHLPVITGILSVPASLLFDPDSFYFGVLPLLSETYAYFGGQGIAVGQAAIMGQMTTGFPVSPLTGSTYLLIGLTGVELGEHQRRTLPMAFLVTVVILLVSIMTGVIPV